MAAYSSTAPTVTAALIAEALAEGDMGIALACLAPGGVATALGLWGDAQQQAAYLPAFAGDTPPAAALALAEPRVLFDPLQLQTRATRTSSGDFVLDGVKSLVPRGADAELLLVAARLTAHHHCSSSSGRRRAPDSASSPIPGWAYAPPPPRGSRSMR